ncbi:major histocompatibility complex class I-related gene protein-like [Labeo rohita]|uniref:Major histocompatibility complex class I-related gene protein-like n=1 Tax=Labeo rohita TaxID=84645 RepID=A0A498P2H3_LABRO|nr:major histocompatibility complex class I-related gene protein-like [Labeo rohita]
MCMVQMAKKRRDGEVQLHTFITTYTERNGETIAGIPEFSAVTTLDGQQIDYYDSEIKKLIPRQVWMKEFASGDKWKEYTEIRERVQQINKININFVMQLFNHSHGFYPSGVTITWLRNGQEHHEDVDLGNLLPNEDGTFQKTLSLYVIKNKWKKDQYVCVVKHKGKTIQKILTEDEVKSNDRPTKTYFTIPVNVFIVILIVLLIGTCIKKDWMTDYASTDMWKEDTAIRQYVQQIYKTNILHLMERFNQSHDVYTYQRMYGCDWDDETGDSHGFDQHGYDGEDFITLDIKELMYITALPEALITTARTYRFVGIKCSSFVSACLHITQKASYESHTFFTLYIEINGLTIAGIPEISSLSVLDERQIDYYDGETKKLIPRQDWMKEFTSGDRFEEYIEFRERAQQINKISIHLLMQRFNQSHGVHTYQRMCGCDCDDKTGDSNGFDEHGYDGEDFISLDMKELRYISPVPQGITVQKWNYDRKQLDLLKQYYTYECIYWLKKFLTLRKVDLERKAPEVSLLQKDPSSSVVSCHATSFYPSAVTITWLRNGQENHEDVDLGETLPNVDGTFQKTVTLNVPPDNWKKDQYVCLVEHEGKSIQTTLTKKNIKSNYAITWLRNGEEHHEDVDPQELLPNEDGTFQKFPAFPVLPDEWMKNQYVPVMENKGKTIQDILAENEIKRNDKQRLPSVTTSSCHRAEDHSDFAVHFDNYTYLSNERVFTIMKFIIFFIYVPFVYTELHTFTNLYTEINGRTIVGIPEISSVTLLDGQQIDYYDSETNKLIPKQDWMKEFSASGDKWEEYIEIRERVQQINTINITILMQQLNHLHAFSLQVFARIRGCMDVIGMIRLISRMGLISTVIMERISSH